MLEYYYQLLSFQVRKQQYKYDREYTLLQLILRKMSHRQTKIELYVTMALDSVQSLFDFNSNQQKQMLSFKAMQFHLPLPKPKQMRFFFIHKLGSMNRLSLKIEHWKPKGSLSAESSFLPPRDSKLLGGIVLEDREGKVIMQLINAEGSKSIRAQREKKLLLGIDNQMAQIKKDMSPNEVIEMKKMLLDRERSINSEQISTSVPQLVIRSFPQGYPLSNSQVIKLGKCHIKVLQAEQYHMNYENMKKEGRVLNVNYAGDRGLTQQEDREGTAHTPTENTGCRFCYEHTQDQSDVMIAPCKCMGSSGKVHFCCLKEWVQSRKQKAKTQNPFSSQQFSDGSLQCQVCKSSLPIIVEWGGQRHYLLDSFKDQQPVVKLEWTDAPAEHLNYRFSVGEKPITIGRSQGNSIEMMQPSVSRKHAEISLNKEGKIVIRDRQSKFGTLLQDDKAAIALSRHSYRAFQVQNFVFSLKIVPLESYQ